MDDKWSLIKSFLEADVKIPTLLKLFSNVGVLLISSLSSLSDVLRNGLFKFAESG